MSDIVQQTELDKAVSSPYLNMIKAAVPYVENPTKSTLATFAKTLEVINAQKMLSEPERLEACSLDRHATEPIDMLHAMKHVGHGRDIVLIDIMIHLFHVNKLILKYSELESNKEDFQDKKHHWKEKELRKEIHRDEKFDREHRRDKEHRIDRDREHHRNRDNYVNASSNDTEDTDDKIHTTQEEERSSRDKSNDSANTQQSSGMNLQQEMMKALMGGNFMNNQSSGGSQQSQPAMDNQMIESLKSMLTPEQRSTFNMLSQMMNNNS